MCHSDPSFYEKHIWLSVWHWDGKGIKTRSLNHMINLSLFFIICSFTLLPFLHCTNYTIIVFTFPSIQLLPFTHSSVLHYLDRSIKGACITMLLLAHQYLFIYNFEPPPFFFFQGRKKIEYFSDTIYNEHLLDFFFF